MSAKDRMVSEPPFSFFSLPGAGLLLAVCAAALTPSAMAAQIAGTSHDFSGEAWSGGEICIVCHTPHDADVSVADAPLWNHAVTSASFQTYNSPTMDETPVAPRGPSLLCLSCHDGTVASDSYGGNTGSEFITGAALMGTDLRDDHPVSVFWNHQTRITTCTTCHFAHGPITSEEVPFSQQYVECSTCHDVHGTPEPSLLRMTMSGSQLCLHCHHK